VHPLSVRNLAQRLPLLLVIAGWLLPQGALLAAQHEPVRVAVAANFKATIEHLAAEFSKQTGELRPVISSGASGLLYSQIVQNAPFDLFYSADQDRPARLEADGLTESGSRYTYAVGKLVAWRSGRAWAGTLEQALQSADTKVVAIANPAVAPYGVAAQQVLQALQLWSTPPYRVVQGESIGQTFQFVATGNAQLGFIALSQVIESRAGSQPVPATEVLEIDQRLYTPIAQDAVRLKRSVNPAAARFFDYVRSNAGRALIAEAGYATDP
jgi:molybdate transport system substrate-binding protein